MATKKTTTAKAAAKPEVKAETKTTAKTAEVKVETKATEKKETATTTKKAEPKKETVKKETAKKETVKKAPAKKETAKKTTNKAETKVFVQFYGKEVDTEAVKEAAKADYLSKSGKKTAKNVQVYIKPEDDTAYYVIDGVEGSVSL